MASTAKSTVLPQACLLVFINLKQIPLSINDVGQHVLGHVLPKAAPLAGQDKTGLWVAHKSVHT